MPFKVDEYRKRMKTLSITSLAFSALGDQLLVNLGGEQLYLYDFVTTSQEDDSSHESYQSFKLDSYKSIFGEEPNDEQLSPKAKKPKQDLVPKAEVLKQKANSCFEAKNYVEAIEYYNIAIEIVSDSSILYGNRAAALMKRGW